MDMEMKKTARTALLSALFTVLLAPGAFAEKVCRLICRQPSTRRLKPMRI